MELIRNEKVAVNTVELEFKVSKEVFADAVTKAFKKANKEIERAYDLIHSSPSKSHRSVEVLEMDIKNIISELENAVTSDNVEDVLQLTKKIISTTEERNRRLKML